MPTEPLPPLGVGRSGGVLWARLALIGFMAFLGVLLITRHHLLIGAIILAMAALRLFVTLRLRRQMEAIRQRRGERFGR